MNELYESLRKDMDLRVVGVEAPVRQSLVGRIYSMLKKS